jgi:hypothetical protein
MMRLKHLAAVFAVLGLTVAPAVGATSGRYVGHTSDKRSVSFRVSGGKVRNFSFQTRFQCSNHTGFVARATFAPIKLRGQRFSAAFSNRAGSLKTTIKGTINGRRATGTIRRRATYNSARRLVRGGHLVCTSSTRFTARR